MGDFEAFPLLKENSTDLCCTLRPEWFLWFILGIDDLNREIVPSMGLLSASPRTM